MKTPATWYRRSWEFVLAPVVDSYKGISITRILVIFYALMAWRAMELNRSIGLNLLWLALGTIAAAFGKSTFSFLLERMQFSGAAVQTDTTVTTRDLRLPSKHDDEREGGA